MIVTYAKLFMLQGVAAIASILCYWQISRTVDPSVYGQYSLYLSIIGAAAFFFISWTNAALLRFGREEWTSRKSIGETLASRLLLYVAGMGLAVVIAFFFDRPLARFLTVEYSPFFLIVAGIAIFPLTDLSIYSNQAIGRPLVYGWAPLTGKVVFLLGLSIIPLADKVEYTYLVKWFLAGILLAALSAFLSMPKHSWRNARPTGTALKKILRYSWALPLGAVTAYTVQWVDSWAIRAYMTTSDVGLYTWAYQITALGVAFFAPVGLMLTPSMVDAKVAGDNKRLGRHAHVSLRLMILTGIAGTAMLPVVYPLLHMMADISYWKSYPVILILLSALPLSLLSYLMNPIGNALEFIIPRVVLISAGMAVLNVLGDIIIIIMFPFLGLTGPALVTWGAFLYYNWMLVHLLRKHLDGFPTLVAFVAAGMIMPMGAFFLWLFSPLTGGLICLLLSVTVLLLTRRKGIYSAEDATYLEAQNIPEMIKKPVTAIFSWLANSEVAA